MIESSPDAVIQYPPPRLIHLRGVWVVKVSIPVQMRHLFGNGSATTRDRRKSTKTSDHKLAMSRAHQLAQVIYDEFDVVLRRDLDHRNFVTDRFAQDTIVGLASSFEQKNIPELVPQTNFSQLVRLRQYCDVYADMVLNVANNDDLVEILAVLTNTSEPEALLEKFSSLPVGPYTSIQKGMAGRYKSEIVHNFWQDLLILAAREQGLQEPNVQPFSGKKMATVLLNGQIVPNLIPLNSLAAEPINPVSRPARIVPFVAPTISSVMNGYLEDMCLKQKNTQTQRKLTRWTKQFLDLMGDAQLTDIKPKHGYDYIRAVLKAYPDRSNKTLKDYLWGIQNLLKYCVEMGYIDANPFTGLDLSKYGQDAKETYPYSLEELRLIFAHSWGSSERLLLSILATTGMRPSEAGNLTWERFNDTAHHGIRYFSTLDTNDEQVRTKNKPSKREVPIHPNLFLPEKSVGRLFNYPKDNEGLSSTSIAHAVNPILNQLVPHPNKSVRSLRRTFKILLRDLGVGEEVHDEITGHKNSTASRQNYGGMGLPVKFEAVSRLDVSFLGHLQT